MAVRVACIQLVVLERVEFGAQLLEEITARLPAAAHQLLGSHVLAQQTRELLVVRVL